MCRPHRPSCNATPIDYAQVPFPLSRARPAIGLDSRFRGNDELTDLRCQFASTAKASSRADGPRKPKLAATPGAGRQCGAEVHSVHREPLRLRAEIAPPHFQLNRPPLASAARRSAGDCSNTRQRTGCAVPR